MTVPPPTPAAHRPLPGPMPGHHHHRPVPLPSQSDDTVRRATAVIGGPWGRHAAAHGWWSPLRVILAIASFTLVLAYLQKSPCADGRWAAYEQYTRACYSDVVPLWGGEGLSRGHVPYRDHAVEYPILTGATMWASAEVTRVIQQIRPSWSDIMIFGAVTCALLALCGLLTAAGVVGAAGRRPYDAALFALSPLLVFHAYSNWDLVAMALASGALWAWARHKPVLAGVLIGLGAAAKLYPALLLVPIVVLAFRTAIWRPAAWCVASAGLTWAAVNAPTALAYREGWWEFYSFSAERDAEASTFWAMANYLDKVGFGGGIAPGWQPPGAAVALMLFAALGAVALLAITAPVRPRMGQLAFLVVLAFLLTTKVWSPQYSVWLVPLLALARPRWRLSLIWQGAEIGVWITTLLWLAALSTETADDNLDYGWLMLVLLTRDGLLLAIAGLIIREMWHPHLDVVRASGQDDPAGGVYDGAPDRADTMWEEESAQRLAD